MSKIWPPWLVLWSRVTYIYASYSISFLGIVYLFLCAFCHTALADLFLLDFYLFYIYIKASEKNACAARHSNKLCKHNIKNVLWIKKILILWLFCWLIQNPYDCFTAERKTFWRKFQLFCPFNESQECLKTLIPIDFPCMGQMYWDIFKICFCVPHKN